MSADDAYAYFVARVAEIALSHGKRPVQWGDVYTHSSIAKNTLPKEVVLHVWRKTTNVTAPLADGYNVILNVGYDGLSWYVFSSFRTRITTCHSDRAATGPDFVPGLPHALAHSRRYLDNTFTDWARLARFCVFTRMPRVESSRTGEPHRGSSTATVALPRRHCQSHCHVGTAYLTRHILRRPTYTARSLAAACPTTSAR